MARPGTHRVMTTRKLHRLAKPVHSEVSTPVERLRDIDDEAGGQRSVNAKAGGLRVRSKIDQVRSSNQKYLGHKAKT